MAAARIAAKARYQRSVLMLSIAYALILFGVVAFFNNGPPSGPLAYVAAALPAFPIVAIIFAMGRYLIDEPDEYLRLKMVRQALVATAFMLAVATVWGFLESFELVAHVDSYWAAILWFGGLGLGSCFNRVTLGDGGC